MVSVDDEETNKSFAESTESDFPLLSDPAKTTAEAYGVLTDFGGNFGILAQRWTFYIGTDGNILKVDRGVSPNTAGEDVVATLAELNIPKR